MKFFPASALCLLIVGSLLFACTDDSDDVVNPGPVIILNDIEDGDSFQVGTQLSFTATLEDEDGIDYAEVTITGGPFPFSERENDFPLNDDGIYSFTYEFQIPQGFAGEYQVEIVAVDMLGNQSTETLDITVTP